ncbi:MAG: DUF2059 domain-containing protein [Sphingobacteriaceae bacterium]|nr:DUF2059 domain-containing protein [Sphingobacteriaceae bacterium]
MKTFLLAIILAATSLNVHAQTNKEKVTELFKLMNLDKMIDGMMDNMASMMKQQNASLKNEQGVAAFDEYMGYVLSETKAFSKRMINGDMVDIYTKHFSDEDIQNFIQFYSSASGKKMIELQPLVQKELMNSMMTKEMPALQAKFQKKLEELKSKKK